MPWESGYHLALTSGSQTDLWAVWLDAAGRPTVADALGRLFADLGADIAARKPTCWLSGRCCKFDSFGHKLYVTGLEIAWMVVRLDSVGRARLANAELADFDGCPFQIDKLCSVHALRPLGCRVYFCDANAQQWQNAVYESFLDRLRALHEQFGLEYRYIEWRAGLAECRDCMAGPAAAAR